MISTKKAGWRLVHDGKDVITFDYFDKNTETQSIYSILEFTTKELGLAKITQLNLNYVEPVIE